MTIEEQLKKHEGNAQFPYKDSVGKLTIGVGRNLTDVGLRESEIELLLSNDIANAVADLDKNMSWWRNLDGIRQKVLIDMCFNMGINSLLGFKNTLHFIQIGEYENAATNMLQSKWAAQVGLRAQTLSTMMRTGIDME